MASNKHHLYSLAQGHRQTGEWFAFALAQTMQETEDEQIPAVRQTSINQTS